MKELPYHVKNLLPLCEIASQIIVVDSESKDGTLDYLKDALSEHKVLYLNHPPGLYPSWNHAIAAADQEYLTMATVGDSLPATSLLELYQTMLHHKADVVVSPPSFIGSRASTMRWPVHDMIQAANIQSPVVVPNEIWLFYAVFHMPNTLLGSSSSNLYRTRVLKDNPFPIEYGHMGDSVWSLQMSLTARWVVHPNISSIFHLHEDAPHKAATSAESFEKIRRISSDLIKITDPCLKALNTSDLLIQNLAESINACGKHTLANADYKSSKSRAIPAMLNFRARKLRRLRKALKAERSERIKNLGEWITNVSNQIFSKEDLPPVPISQGTSGNLKS